MLSLTVQNDKSKSYFKKKKRKQSLSSAKDQIELPFNASEW